MKINSLTRTIINVSFKCSDNETITNTLNLNPNLYNHTEFTKHSVLAWINGSIMIFWVNSK